MLRLMDKILHDPKDPKLWNYGIFLVILLGNAGFCPSTDSSNGRIESVAIYIHICGGFVIILALAYR